MKFGLFILLGFTSILIEAAPRKCRKSEWSCDDGTCIEATAKCDGAEDCPDSSDENFLRCRTNYCVHGFRCVYGGCVAKNASCNGIRDCADNSDELLLECRDAQTLTRATLWTNTTDIIVKERYKHLLNNSCKNGQTIDFSRICDGKVDCDDGSDEMLRTCASDIHGCTERGSSRFRCRYGACIDESKVCDGEIDCMDNSDEQDETCEVYVNKNEGEWYCNDGTRIDAVQTCNGAVDCPDGSDETFVLCWNNRRINCYQGFKCAYGGCVESGTACNGIKDCADNSDELQLKCRNETFTLRCLQNLYGGPSLANLEARSKECKLIDSLCKNGERLNSSLLKCNGRVDCTDGSDETLESCATDIHECTSEGEEFRCQYGACIERKRVCDTVKDCADGSDEFFELCSAYTHSCVLPDLPKNGNYTVPNMPNAYPGQTLDEALLIFTCFPGYKLIGRTAYVNCKEGRWLNSIPICVSQCPLAKHPSLTFSCLPRGPLLSLEIESECEELVPDGAIVRPECRKPVYQYTTGHLPFMHCVDGIWDRPLPTCSPECGLITSQGDILIINGTSAIRGELPWHAAIYTKLTKPYKQICGGSLISNTIIITAAHCFWSDTYKLLPAEDYAAALGKIYRPWNDPNDIGLQRSDIKDIKIPPRFQGATTNFQDDIALVVLVTPIVYQSHVRPVCIDFDTAFENTQLVEGNKGKVAGWGLTSIDGKASPVLKVAELPYINVSRCLNDTDLSFRGFITSDKICAGNEYGSALCKGDSGGGLVFAAQEHTEQRYFLRGVVSTSPRSHATTHACTVAVHTTFTLISRHKPFIQEYWH